MGLLLSILVACVGVVEIVTFYTKITRTLTSQSTQTTNFDQLSEFYIEELKKHRTKIEEDLQNIDRENVREEESKRLRRSAKRYFLTEDTQSSRYLTIEDIDDHCKKQDKIIITEDHSRSRSPSPIPRRLGDQDCIFQRSPSPYPCLILPVSKTTVSSDNPTCLLEVDEELSRSPSPDNRCILGLSLKNLPNDNAPDAKSLDHEFLDSLDGVKKKKLSRTSSLRQSRKKRKDHEG